MLRPGVRAHAHAQCARRLRVTCALPCHAPHAPASRYYQNFKLFQYCFTQSHVLVLTSRSNPAETAPPAFLPLAEAVPARVVVPAPAADPAEGVAEAPAAAPEASPAAEDLGLDVPEEMKDVILRKIQVEVAKLQREMDAAHQEREARLLKKIAALEAAPPAKGK